MKILATAAAAAALIAVPAAAQGTPRSGTENPTATHLNPSSCLGAERATRNSNGGDRAQGGFGPAQSDYVHTVNQGDEYGNYGQFLKDWKSSCDYAPGMNDGS